IRSHLHGCPHCAAKHEDVLALRAQLRANVPRHAAPAALRARIAAVVQSAQRPARTRRWPGAAQLGWLGGGALAGCAARLVAWTASGRAFPSSPVDVRGFRVARWSGAGMEWLAGSDAEPAVLSALVERLARDAVAP